MRTTPFLLLGSAIATPAAAGTVTVTIPRLNVAEYHRPYVAVWLEPEGGGPARTIAVWYDIKKGGNEPGTKWLSDLRAWWRKGGRSLKMPADGVSGATRAPGRYTIPLPRDLRPGNYILNVEAARETGGRELVSLPVAVPNGSGKASGRTELGPVSFSR
ncbi:hypothetical protein GCM10007897_17990 [Sphingobium jiangsuense]|uniref:DUF2271 domain-containing protein n=1 Tax=Sphingobium jiangsuense TaxID=870476 RepID=A0A7W6BD99_9SPHN|nr:DUF2271 domain-containing protein [Sphingobium jiangsuense]MBB3924736.1 hypothetical protein [Sphingobium jiangsuense]GLT00413.1 hypothetical protein GCM10007897_17990 [Sphingobium jiangsuense]